MPPRPKRGRGSYGIGGPGTPPDTSPVRKNGDIKRRRGVENQEWPGHRRQGGPPAPVGRPTKVASWIYDASLANREPIKYVQGVLRKYGQRLNGPNYREFDEVRSPQSADGIAGRNLGIDPISQALVDIRAAKAAGPGAPAPRGFSNPGVPVPPRPDTRTRDEQLRDMRHIFTKGLGEQARVPLSFADLPQVAAAIARNGQQSLNRRTRGRAF